MTKVPPPLDIIYIIKGGGIFLKKFFSAVVNYFKDWNWFELLFVFTFEIAFIVLGIIFKQTAFSIIYSITILLCAFLLTKGKWYAYIFGLIGISCYVHLSFTQHYWGEAVWHLCLTIPMYITSLCTWKKNQLKKVVKQRKISKLEWCLFLLGSAIVCVCLYFILNAVNTPQALTSSCALMFSGMANYLAMRRSDFSFVAYCFDDIFVIVLWIIPVIKGDIALLNVAITMFGFLINDIYGVINWSRIKKEQTKELQNQEMAIKESDDKIEDSK